MKLAPDLATSLAEGITILPVICVVKRPPNPRKPITSTQPAMVLGTKGCQENRLTMLWLAPQVLDNLACFAVLAAIKLYWRSTRCAGNDNQHA
jgi:hypothetical protein